MSVHIAEQPAPAGRARRGRRGALDGIDTARLHDYSMAELGAHCTAFNCRKMTNAGKVIYGRLLNHIQDSGRHEELDLSFGDFLDQVHQREPSDPKRGQLSSRDYEYKQIAVIDLSDLPERPIPVRCMIAVQESGPTGVGVAEVAVRRGLFALAQSYKEDEAHWLASVAQQARDLLEGQPQVAAGAGVAASVAQVKPVLAMLEEVAAALSARREAATRQRRLDQAEHIVVDEMDELTQGMKAAEVIARMERMERQLQRVLERARAQESRGAQGGRDAAPDPIALVAASSGCAEDAARDPAPGPGFVVDVDAADAPDSGRAESAAPRAADAAAAIDIDDMDDMDGDDGDAAAEDAAAGDAAAGDAAEDSWEDGPAEPSEAAVPAGPWYAPVAHALVAGMTEDQQRELSRQLRLVVQARPIESYESYLRDQWEGCGMEAAGVEREIYDDVMEVMCGPDWIHRSMLALGLLSEGKPKEWGLNVHLLKQFQLPEELRSEVLRLSRTVRRMEPRVEDVEEDEREVVQRILDGGGPAAAQMLDDLEEIAYLKLVLERVDWKTLDDRVQRRLNLYSGQRVLDLARYHGIPKVPLNQFDDDPDPVYDTYDPLARH